MFKCTGCGATNKRQFYVCPSCGGSDIVEEAEAPKIGKTVNGGKAAATLGFNRLQASNEAKAAVKDKIKRVGDKSGGTVSYEVIKKTSFPGFNELVSNAKGLVTSQVILLGADAGTGKTTLMSQIAEEDTLFISTEETFAQVSNRFQRVNPSSRANILSTTSCDEIMAAVEECEETFIVLDSINSIENGTLSYVRIAQIVQELTNIIKRTNKCAVLISQVGRGGEIIGMNSAIHAVDTVLSMSRSPVSENITCVSTKNRFGSVGNILLVRHRENGLEEVEQESMDFAEGTVCFYMQAGAKKMPFSVQALICGCQDSRPMRRGIGVTPNQIFLWNAILGCNDKGYTTSDSDIYMSTSNGIPLAPGNDIAALAALLSSYYDKIVQFDPDDLKGMVSLNGTISGNRRFKHIREIISLYKKP